jgi:ectoine hydroxylase-related dioxygenase (phytanoyl-CoA dioxygenase family)
MQSSLSVFGVKEFSAASSEVEQRVEEIGMIGYTIVPDALTESELETARRKVDEIYRRQTEEVGGENELKKFNDAYTARALLAYDEFFLGVATNPKVLPIVEALLGDYYILMLQNGIINVPAVGGEQNAGSWHRDLNYQHFVSSRPLSVSALFCVDEFSSETGGTHVLPGSHKMEIFPSEATVLSNERTITAPAGSVIVFDSMLFHRGGLNRSANTRRALNHMYTLPLIRQQISFPRMLGGKFSEDAFLRRFLGYEAETADNVRDWREERKARITTTPTS